MKDLAKLDLEPDEVYNVSLSVSQGTKKFDNLRFFQTKVPKLFNLIPSQYTTFSRVTTALEPIVPKISGGTYDDADLITVDLEKLEWTVNWKYNRSEGETSYDLGASTVTIRLTFGTGKDANSVSAKRAGIPDFSYEIKGFPGVFNCLNGRTDWKRVNGQNNKVFELVIPVTEFDPGITAAPKFVNNRINIPVNKAMKKGSKTVTLDNEPRGIFPGLTSMQIQSDNAPKAKIALPANTKVAGINLGAKTATAAVAVSRDVPSSWTVVFDYYAWVYKVSWSNETLNPNDKGSDDPNSASLPGTGILAGAKGYYYDAPVYTPIKSTYDFKGSSTINTELLNATVLDAIVWENEVRDFVYFFISDTIDQTSPTWYYFSNIGGITAATPNSKILGASSLSIKNTAATGDNRVLNDPPDVPSYVSDVSQFPSYPPAQLRAKARFYSVSKTGLQTATDPTPQINYNIAVRFAIARYTKVGSTWNGVWLGSDNLIKNVLSLPEPAGA